MLCPMVNPVLLVQIGDEFSAANTFGATVAGRSSTFTKVRRFAQPGWSNSGVSVGLNHNPILWQALEDAGAVTLDVGHRPLFSAIEALVDGEDPDAGDRPLLETVRSAYERSWKEVLDSLAESPKPATCKVVVLVVGRYVPEAMPGKFDRQRATAFLSEALDFAAAEAKRRGFDVVDLDPVIRSLAGDKKAWPLARSKHADDVPLTRMAARLLDEEEEEASGTTTSTRRGSMISDLAKYLVLDERGNEAVAVEVAKVAA